MGTMAPVSDFREFWSHRLVTHMIGWFAAIFCVGWVVAFVKLLPHFSVVGSVFAGLVIAVVCLCIYGMCCLFIVPLLPQLALAALSVALEWHWRLAHGRPWTPPAPEPYIPPVTPVVMPSAPPRARGGFGWLLPLAIGLWIGSSWGDDD